LEYKPKKLEKKKRRSKKSQTDSDQQDRDLELPQILNFRIRSLLFDYLTEFTHNPGIMNCNKNQSTNSGTNNDFNNISEIFFTLEDEQETIEKDQEYERKQQELPFSERDVIDLSDAIFPQSYLGATEQTENNIDTKTPAILKNLVHNNINRLARIRGIEASNDVANKQEPRTPLSDEITCTTVITDPAINLALLDQSISIILNLYGYQGIESGTLEVFNDVVSSYVLHLGQIMRGLLDEPGTTNDFLDIVDRALLNGNPYGIDTLKEFLVQDLQKFNNKLKNTSDANVDRFVNIKDSRQETDDSHRYFPQFSSYVPFLKKPHLPKTSMIPQFLASSPLPTPIPTANPTLGTVTTAAITGPSIERPDLPGVATINTEVEPQTGPSGRYATRSSGPPPPISAPQPAVTATTAESKKRKAPEEATPSPTVPESPPQPRARRTRSTRQRRQFVYPDDYIIDDAELDMDGLAEPAKRKRKRTAGRKTRKKVI